MFIDNFCCCCICCCWSLIDNNQRHYACAGRRRPRQSVFIFFPWHSNWTNFNFATINTLLALCLCFFQCFRLSSGLFIVSLFVYFSLHFIILKASIFELVQIKKQISPFCRRARCNYLRQNGMITTNEIKNNETQCIITLIIIIG